MSVPSIQNQLLEVTVVECSKLKDTEWISRQDPYVCLQYGSTKFRTRTCTDGGKNPIFQEKFMFTLIQGLREISVAVWNSNTLTTDDFIGSGKIQIQGALSGGYDDKSWTIHSKSGRYAGEVKLILHYAQPSAPAASYGAPAPPYVAPFQAQPMSYSAPPPVTASYANPACPPPYPTHSSAYQTPIPYPSHHCCPPPHQTYSSSPYPYPPDRSIYPPPAGYPTPSTYPPPPHASPYPPQRSSPYPPSHASPYPPTSSYGLYPPPPY